MESTKEDYMDTESSFTIKADISEYLDKMLNHVDKYTISFYLDFIENRLSIVGISPTKSKLVSIITKFNTIEENLEGTFYYSFVCKLPKFKNYNSFTIKKENDNIFLGTDETIRAVFYDYNLITDWDGTGESVYDHCVEINSEFFKEKLLDISSGDLVFTIDENSMVKMKVIDNNEDEDCLYEKQYILGNTKISKKGFDKVKYTVNLEDLKEVVNEYIDNEFLTIYLNKDSPVLIKKKTKNSLKKSYMMFAII